jgi:hypothetical protein
VKLKIKQKESFLSKKGIKLIEKKYKAKFVGVFSLKQSDGWRNFPSYIFYVEKPEKMDYSNYIAVSQEILSIDPLITRTVVSDGSSFNCEPIFALKADNGEVIYSAYRNDYEESGDGSAWIDGGRQYTRYSPEKDLIELEIVDGEIKIKEHGRF